MGTVSAFEAKTRFGSILDRVAAGEEIVITRHDKPIARLVPEGGPSNESMRQLVKDIHAFRARLAARGFKPLTDAEIKASINEGRP